MKNRLKKVFISILLILGAIVVQPVDSSAQCPMCRMSVESNLNAGGKAGRGLNAGILYMLATPYLMVGVIGFVWWKNKKKVDQDLTKKG